MKVAIAIEMHYPYPWHLEMSQGIMQYGEEHGWTCVIDPYLLSLSDTKATDFDGVIGRINQEIGQALEGHELPAVNVMGSNFVTYLDHIPSLKMDVVEGMRMMVDHLITSGYRCFGYIGIERLSGHERKLAFLAEVLAAHDLPPAKGLLLADDFDHERETTLEVRAQLIRWLTELDKPVGLLVQDATIPSLLIPLCKEMGLRVPHDVGIVGMNTDESMSLASSPTLSYISSDYYQHGYQAAALLGDLMAGKKMHPKHRLFKPDRVIVRESSDVFLCSDPLVSDAVRYIAGHLRQNPGVEEVAEHLGVSRRKLERHFAESLGRTIQNESKRLRVDLIKSLILETERSLSNIAIDFGFSSTSYFAKYFKDEVGMTPSAYRKQYGKPSANESWIE